MADALFCEKGALELGWLLFGEKKENGLEMVSFSCFGTFEERKIGRTLRIMIVWTKKLVFSPIKK